MPFVGEFILFTLKELCFVGTEHWDRAKYFLFVLEVVFLSLSTAFPGGSEIFILVYTDSSV